jgi:hypothetical protein
MRKQITFLLLTLILFSTNLYSKEAGFSFEIADSLKKNADAVYLFYNTTYTRLSKASMKESEHYAVTILSDRGDYFAEFEFFYNKFSTIDNIECTIYDAEGKKVRKIKNSEISDYAAFDGFSLFSDARVKKFEALNPTYPYTIEVKVESSNNGFIGIPSWYPIEGYKQGIKETSLTVKFPADYPVKFRENNIGSVKKTESIENNFNCIAWSCGGIKAIESERFTPPFFDQVPSVSFAPVDFVYDNCQGSFNDWKSLGAWKYSILDKNYQLGEQTINQLNSLKSEFADKKILAEKVYKYMQSRTCYVGIQLGIGGWKPFSPEVVDKVGYGDCKALTYYTKALLEFVGINSIYTTIGSYSRKIVFDDFANLNQSNHVILCVPFEKDTVWLECTSQTAPFNHLFDGTSGRKALLVTPEGGKLVKTAEPLENKCEKTVSIKMNSNSDFTCEMKSRQTGSFYDDDFEMLQLSGKELNEKLIKESGISDLTLVAASVSQDEAIPALIVSKTFTTKSFTSKAGNRMFIEMSPFTSVKKIAEQKTARRTPVYFEESMIYSDEVVFQIPEGFSIEFIPEKKTITSEFGSFSSQFEAKENTIRFTQTLNLNKGTYPKEKYPVLIQFINQVAEANKNKTILKM